MELLYLFIYISNSTCHICCSIWLKFGITDLDTVLLSHGRLRDYQNRDGRTFRTWVNRIACMVPCDICSVKNALVNITYVRRHGVHHVHCGLVLTFRAVGSRSCNFHVA